jgi:hypothetical protein
MTTDDEIRSILNDTDTDRLRKLFLCALKDMNGTEDHYVNFSQVYEQMGFRGYNLPFAMRVVIQDILLPQAVIQIKNDQVLITEKGRHRCDQFRHTDEYEWKETLTGWCKGSPRCKCDESKISLI